MFKLLFSTLLMVSFISLNAIAQQREKCDSNNPCKKMYEVCVEGYCQPSNDKEL